MTAREAATLASAIMLPVAVWLAGRLLQADPSASAGLWAVAVQVLWLLQALALLAGIPLLVRPQAPRAQLAGATVLAVAPWPLLALAVLAGGLSWPSALAAGAGALGLATLVPVASRTLVRRTAGAAPREQVLRVAMAVGLALPAWAGHAHWGAWLAGL